MGTQSPSPKGGRAPPQFSAHLYCGQTAGCIKMPLGMEIGLSPGDFVLDGDPAPYQKSWRSAPIFIVLDGDPALLPKRGRSPLPIFGSCLLWPNGWMDQVGTWYGGGLWWRPHCAKRGQSPSIFGPFLLSPNGRMHQDATWYGGRPRPRRLCVRWGPSYH